MKKISIYFICALFFSTAFCQNIDTDYEMPGFDSDTAYIIDATQYKGKFSQFVKVFNYSRYKELSFSVYVHSPVLGGWDSLGNANLKGFDTDATLGAKYKNLSKHRYFVIEPSDKGERIKMKGRGKGDINDWFYYAIVPSTGKRYRYTFNDKHDDLNIFVMDSFEADDDKEVSSNEYALPNARKVNGEVAPIL